MSGLNAESQRFLEAAFGTAGEAWVVRGHYDAKDDLKVLEEGPAGSFDLPDGDDLYYCVGKVTGNRKAVERVMVLVIDDVGKEIDLEEFELFFPLEASFKRESSAGSFQYGYLIDGGMEPEDFKALREAMKASPIWGGAHNTGAAAIYRLPQGTHTKSTRGGWAVREGLWDGRKHSRDDAWSALGNRAGEAPVAAAGGAASKFEWLLGEEALAELVDLIPNDASMDRAAWAGVAHGIAGAGGGFEIFERFSDRWTEGVVDPAETARVWDTLPTSQARGGKLREKAEKASPDGFAVWKAKWEPGVVFDDGEALAGDIEAVVAEAPAVTVAIEAHQLKVADEIVARQGDRIRLNVDTGQWHRWGGGVWAPVKTKLGFQLATEWARTAAPGLRPAMRAAVQKAGFFEGVESILRQDARLVVGEDAFDQDDWLLGTPGGTVDLRTGVLRGALAGDMISRCCRVTPSDREDCPVWKKRLIGWMTTVGGVPDLEMQRFLQQWAGVLLTGDTSIEKLLFLYGDGSNGKGSYVETMAWILGTYFVQPARDLFMAKKHARHQQEIASLAGARMVAVSEVPPSGEWDEMLLKDVTGGGTISANFMRQNQFTFRVRFKVTISGNEQPTFSGRISQALRRRFLLATFPNVAKPIDPDFKPGLRKEAPGILRWAINGLVDMRNNGGLLVPTSVMAATDRYMNDEDLFGAWLGARVSKVAGGQAGASDLMQDWIEHRNREGNHTLIDNQRKFGEEMRRRGFENHKTMNGWVYKNTALKAKVSPF